MGHPLKGWKRNPQVTTWCFDEAAAADCALYDDPDLYDKLPESTISYTKAAVLGHLGMSEASKQVMQASIEHKGRTALIGRDCTPSQIESIEKILFRK